MGKLINKIRKTKKKIKRKIRKKILNRYKIKNSKFIFTLIFNFEFKTGIRN